MTKEWNRFGALIPPVNITVEPEFNEWAPEGVTIHTQRMWRQRAVMSEEDLRDMDKYLDDDCHRLAFAKPHFVMYACTSGSSLETGGYDKKISDRIITKRTITKEIIVRYLNCRLVSLTSVE